MKQLIKKHTEKLQSFVRSKGVFLYVTNISILSFVTSISIMPLNAVAAENLSDTELDYARLQMSDSELLTLIRNNPEFLSSHHKFKACAGLKIQTARLDCFDEVAKTGKDSEYTHNKKQLDLGETIKSTLSGKPKIVIFNPDTVDNTASDDVDNKTTDNQEVIDNTSKPFNRSTANILDITKKIDSLELKKSSVEELSSDITLVDYQIDSSESRQNNSYNKELLLDGSKVVSNLASDGEKVLKTQNSNIDLKKPLIRGTELFNKKPTKFEQQNSSIEKIKIDIERNKPNQLIDISLFNTEANIQSGKQDKLFNTNSSPLSLMYDLDKNDEVGTWKPRPHNPMYIIPLFMHENPNRNPSTPSQDEIQYTQNEHRSSELKFQISFKSKMAQDLFDTDADLWMGYTQKSHWQVYNEDNSRPFRAHDYTPEFFLTQPVYAELPLDGKLKMLSGGLMHHSNGEDDPQSRTWNRIYLTGGAEWDNTWGKVTVLPRIWKRLSAKAKKDENSDIEKFYGYGDVKVYYDMESGQSLTGTFRLNPNSGKGAVEFDYVYPMDNNVNLFLNVFHGYGESLIDYNHKDTTFGVGIMLNDWRGL